MVPSMCLPLVEPNPANPIKLIMSAGASSSTGVRVAERPRSSPSVSRGLVGPVVRSLLAALSCDRERYVGDRVADGERERECDGSGRRRWPMLTRMVINGWGRGGWVFDEPRDLGVKNHRER